MITKGTKKSPAGAGDGKKEGRSVNLGFNFFIGFSFCFTFGLFLAEIAGASLRYAFWIYLIPAAFFAGLIINRLLGS
jgi:hypothetical protein